MADEQKQPTAEPQQAMAEEQKQPTAQKNTEPQQAMESQVTSQTPATKPAKNPKRVAAGKATAEKTRLARQAQKQAYDEKMAKEREKKNLHLLLSLRRKPNQSLLQPIQRVLPQTNGSLSSELLQRSLRLISSVMT